MVKSDVWPTFVARMPAADQMWPAASCGRQVLCCASDDWARPKNEPGGWRGAMLLWAVECHIESTGSSDSEQRTTGKQKRNGAKLLKIDHPRLRQVFSGRVHFSDCCPIPRPDDDCRLIEMWCPDKSARNQEKDKNVHGTVPRGWNKMKLSEKHKKRMH